MAKRKPPINHYDFVRDLVRGQKGEEIAIQFFREELGLTCTNLSDRNPDFDLLIDALDPKLTEGKKIVPQKLLKKIFREAFRYSRKEEITVEVKFDMAAAKYKNIFLEVIFNIEEGVPGGMFKCKADILAWIVPNAGGDSVKIYLFKRPELLAWLFLYIFENKDVKLKTPAISPFTKGVAVPIKIIKESFACVGEFNYKIKGET
jgi:hypothetical protein